MLGFRLNKLGAPLKQGFSLRRLFRPSTYGFLGELSNLATIRQTYNSPATAVTAAGDPIGLVLNTVAGDGITNLLIQTDAYTASSWTKTNTTVTANTRSNRDGVPIAATLNATVGAGTCTQAATITAGTETYITGVDLEQDTATASSLQLVFSGGNTYTAAISWSGGVPTVTAADSATSGDVSGTLVTGGIWRITVRGANTSRTSVSQVIKAGGAGTGTVFASRSNLQVGSTESAYQPNAGSLGGSNRRTGGTNLTTWSEDFANPGWTKDSSAVTDANVWTASAATAVHSITNAATPTVNGLVYTTSVELTPTYRYYQLYANGSATPGFVNYDTQTDTVSATTATGSCTDLGGGRKRLTITYTADAASRYPILAMVTGLAAVRAESWLAAGTESATLHKSWTVLGSSEGTYSRNMDSIGGLLTSVVPYQDVSGDRPTVSRRPRSGIRNLLPNSTPNTANANWSVSNCTDGGSGVFTVSGAGSVSHPIFVTSYTTLNATQYTWSAIVKRRDFQYMGIALNSATAFGNTSISYVDLDEERVITNAAESTTVVSLGDDLYLISSTDTSIAAAATTGLRVYPAISTTGGATATVTFDAATYPGVFEVRSAQLEFGAVVTDHQTVANFWDITEAGQPSVYGWWLDGTSDYLKTGLQSFGASNLYAIATNKFTIFAVVRTLTGGAIMSKNTGSSISSQNFNWGIGGTTGRHYLNCRGVVVGGYSAQDYRDGKFHAFGLRWDGTKFTAAVDKGGRVNLSYSPTSLGDTTIEIAVGIGRVSTLANILSGHMESLTLIDRSVSDSEFDAAIAYLNQNHRYGL